MLKMCINNFHTKHIWFIFNLLFVDKTIILNVTIHIIVKFYCVGLKDCLFWNQLLLYCVMLNVIFMFVIATVA